MVLSLVRCGQRVRVPVPGTRVLRLRSDLPFPNLNVSSSRASLCKAFLERIDLFFSVRRARIGLGSQPPFFVTPLRRIGSLQRVLDHPQCLIRISLSSPVATSSRGRSFFPLAPPARPELVSNALSPRPSASPARGLFPADK